MDTRLNAAQRGALRHVTLAAAQRREEALRRCGIDVAGLAEHIARHGRVTLNFHPDRLLADGRTVAESLAADGAYRSQFATGISNGSRTAFAGGERDRWEERLFGGAYHRMGVTADDRPRYGALNLGGHADGGSPRFGSCHVRLRPAVNTRCTFTVGDSHLAPSDIGTLAAFECVLAGLLEGGGDGIGRADADPVALIHALPVRTGRNGRALDAYVEAQVHGGVELGTDAEAIVADPSFADTLTGEHLARLTHERGIALEWHAGFELSPAEVDGEFRGPHVPPLAAALCDTFARERFDAELVGRAVGAIGLDATGRDGTALPAWGSTEEQLQSVKHLWHTLVAFGHPRTAAGAGRQ